MRHFGLENLRMVWFTDGVTALVPVFYTLIQSEWALISELYREEKCDVTLPW